MNRLAAVVTATTRSAWAVYVAVLTVFLLSPDPAALIGLSRPPGPPGGRWIHFLFFLVLGGATFAARWPLRSAALMALLVLYAVSTETLQWFVPNRTVELLDYLENLAGLVVGAGSWRLLQNRDVSGQPVER